jgi:dihydroorotate dehydrogenase electron transfer subunit
LKIAVMSRDVINFFKALIVYLSDMTSLIEHPIEISKDHYLLRIMFPGSAAHPGQFVNIKIGDTDPLLRRPFSVHHQDGDIIEIIVKIVGNGTRLLAEKSVPGPIDLLAPRGRGFSLIESGSALLVGGGVGNAPLHFLASRLYDKDVRLTYLYGARSQNLVFLQERYESLADEFILATDDGTAGRKGLIADVADEVLGEREFDRVYLCGPAAMMKRITDTLRSVPTPVEVSIENYFGCGIGVCYGCSVETVEGQKRACIDGPVFDGKSLIWDSL